MFNEEPVDTDGNSSQGFSEWFTEWIADGFFEKVRDGMFWLFCIGAAFLFARILWPKVESFFKWYFVERSISQKGIQRVESKWNLPVIYEAIESAKREVLILQTWFPNWQQDMAAWTGLLHHLGNNVSSAEKKRFKMRILLIHPTLYPSRLWSRQDFADAQMQGSEAYSIKRIGKIREFVEKFAEAEIDMAVGFYSNLPFGPAYVVDGVAYWGTFLADKDAMNGHMFVSSTDSSIGSDVLSSFNRTWDVRTHELTPRLEKFEDFEDEANLQNFKALQRHLSEFDVVCKLKPSDYENDAEKLAVAKIDQALASNSQVVVVMRHASTYFNESGIFSGQLPVHISQNGLDQVNELKDLAPKLANEAWANLYCSPADRTRETLEELVGGRDISAFSELGERHVGIFEGRTKVKQIGVKALANEYDRIWDFNYRPDFGESYGCVLERLVGSEFLSGILSRSNKRRSSNTLICTHEGVMKLLVLALDDQTPNSDNIDKLNDIRDIEIENCELIVMARRP